MKLLVLSPHFAPDVAPTGAVMTRIVEELAKRGQEIDVVTSLPWYRNHRVEPGYEGRLWRYEDTPWGRITRIHPFPASDKRDIVRRGLAFAGFSALAAALAGRGERLDAVLAVSPPLTLGLAGYAIARRRHAAFVFNVQDVYPDVAIQLGVLKSERAIAAARRLERSVYAAADAVTVLSSDIEANIASRVGEPSKLHVIPNFVDPDAIRPASRDNQYRRELGLGGRTVVMYAGNLGLSQALDTVLEAASALTRDEDITFVFNGEGAARADLEAKARGMPNVVFVDMQPAERLPEVLAAGDIHLVPLKRGLARASVPSKIYSILAAGRPVIASVDAGSAVAELVELSGAGTAVPPEDAEALAKAIRRLAEAPEEATAMGRAGRSYIERRASPVAAAEAYESLFERLRRDPVTSKPSRPRGISIRSSKGVSLPSRFRHRRS